MTSSSPAPVFGLGRLCVDFVFTGEAGERARWETWHRPANVAAWFAQSDLAPIDVVFDPRAKALAFELREALWLVVRALARRDPVPTEAVGVVNEMARAAPLVPFYDQLTQRVGWVAPTARQCLSTVARDAVALLGDERLRSRVRECENPDCAIVFVDDSRPGARRWCRPERCGDRIRARTYRQRRANDPDGTGGSRPGAPRRTATGTATATAGAKEPAASNAQRQPRRP